MFFSSIKDFQLIGGGDKLVLLWKDDDGVEHGCVINEPFLESLSQQMEYVEISCMGLREPQSIPAGLSTATVSLISNQLEYVTGKDLAKRFDPALKKSVQELTDIILDKLKERDENPKDI
jgi:hypothetical protein